MVRTTFINTLHYLMICTVMHCESISKRTPCGHGSGPFPWQVQITAISTNPRKSGKK